MSSVADQRSKRHGLKWEDALFGSQPQWTLEPDLSAIETLARKHLSVDDDSRCTITFHAQGAFNKLYKVDADRGTWLMRIALPVDPHYKTASEAATINFVREHTNIPVPHIIAFDASNENILGFEWMLMEFMPGLPLRRQWRKISLDTKCALIRQLAHHQAQLFEKQFDSIGNIYETGSPSTFDVGRIVAMSFFWGDRSEREALHGPFRNSYEWLSTQLTLIIDTNKRVLEESEDEDELEDAEASKTVGERVLAALPDVFPRDEQERSFIYHDDLSTANILVDELGNLTAVVDWECVSALPTWRACQLPQLLDGSTRSENPCKEDYAADPNDEDEDVDGERLDNEGVDPLYWEHLQEYEIGQLRPVFITEMERLQPLWVEHFRKQELKNDFVRAVNKIESNWRLSAVQKWLDAFLEGRQVSLESQY